MSDVFELAPSGNRRPKILEPAPGNAGNRCPPVLQLVEMLVPPAPEAATAYEDVAMPNDNEVILAGVAASRQGRRR